ncbi:MAG: nitronate monooxygenase [Acidobacteria bacterium]|jgi:NAD(P)H-dependent flavin oxidoreductase YrpB (nitropropane dioxygenase family)|nr:nitronate monooxygenase [Acidobacteriota bacterium]
MRLKRLSRLNISNLKIPKIKMPQLKIGDSVARLPIVQGGMGVGISLASLASAVANEGGIGVIAANAIGMLEPDYYTNGKEADKRALRKQIRKARNLSNGIIGVNIMVAVNDFHDLLQVAIEEKVDMVFLGAGLPLKGIPVAEIRKAGVKVVPIVSSGRAARLIFSYWQKNYDTIPDAVVVEGPKAGGHLGFKETEINDPGYALENLIPAVAAEVKIFEEQCAKSIPVIAAGGIFTGADIFKFFELGASGVQMATRFVATHECDADKKFKKTYIDCKEEDIVIIKSPVGLPGRAIKNNFLREVDAGNQKAFRCPWRCLESCNAKNAHYCISQALDNARQGKLAGGFAFAGSNAYRINKIIHVNTLVKQLKKEYFKKMEFGTAHLRNEFEEALKNFIVLRNQYIITAKKSLKSLKSELGEILDKGTAAFQEEYQNAMIKLDALKEEYAIHLNRVHELKEQLSKYLDTSALKLYA